MRRCLSLSFACAVVSASAQPKDEPPRKVLVGTVCSRFSGSHEARAEQACKLIDALAAKAESAYAGRKLDLAVLPETALMRDAERASDQCVPMEFVRRTAGAAAKRHGCYVAVGACLTERVGGRDCPRNACVLLDRRGEVVGVYNKVHTALEWGDVKATESEYGMVPGGGFPVFDTDFGKVGFLICFDMSYEDGWAELKRKGAEVVSVLSMSPQVFRPSLFAHRHQYWVVTSTPSDQAAVITPLGFVKGRTDGASPLVEEIDLSFVMCHWSEELSGGAALERRFGKDAFGGIYVESENNGIFWSNRKDLPIGRMIEAVNVRPRDEEAARAERVSSANRLSERGTYR